MTRKNYILLSLLLIFIFSAKDILVLSSKTWPHLYPVVNTSPLTFEEVYCYLPFLNRFSSNNMLPAAPMASSSFSKFTFFPALLIVSQGIIYKLLCFSNPDIYFFVAHFLFPLISFWLLFAIFRKYISVSWSLLLALWGITFFYKFSLFGYYFNLLFEPASVINSASLRPLEITRILAPNFTFLSFIFCFYLSISTYKISNFRYIWLTVLWSLNLYIYLFNFVAGIIFWFGYIVFTRYINDRPTNIKLTLKTLSINFLVMLVVIFPIILLFFSNSGLEKEMIVNLGSIYKNSGIVFNEWGFFFSYLLPLIITITTIRWYCGDYYELIYRFTPIFIMIFVELVVLNLHLLFSNFFHTYLFSIRIGNFFPRFLYYVPVIYFFSNPFKRLPHDQTSKGMSKKVHELVDKYVVGYQKHIATIGIAGVIVAIAFSAVKYSNNHNLKTAPKMKSVQERLNELVSVSEPETTLVSEDLPVNILLPVITKNTSLFVNTFNNYVKSEEIVDRLVLFAKIYKWDEKRFFAFMMPDNAYRDFYNKNDVIVSETMLKKGFGYWCVWHRRKMKKHELAEYKEKLRYKFYNLNLIDSLKRFNVRVVQAFGEINSSLPVKSVLSINNMKLYFIDIV